jgi:hypothetical protein
MYILPDRIILKTVLTPCFGEMGRFLHWEDGSGDFKLADSSEYEIQGEFYRNLGK